MRVKVGVWLLWLLGWKMVDVMVSGLWSDGEKGCMVIVVIGMENDECDGEWALG